MRNSAKTFREAILRFETLDLAFENWRIASDNIGNLVAPLKELSAFGMALGQCKKAAKGEFAYISGRVDEVKAIGNEVSGMALPEFDDDMLGLTADEKDRCKALRDEARKLFEGFKSEFKDEFALLRQDLDKITWESADFKVVLFGRTQVGKSTIREALTCGDGATIGHGSSSTTKTCHEYTWRNLHVWDTPGIDSRKDTNRDESGVGDEERAANEKLETADMAVFVCKTDSLEPKERQRLAQIVASGRPFVILMNVVAQFSNYTIFKRMGSDRKINRERQREFIDDLVGGPHGLHAPDERFSPAEAEVIKANLIPVHACACFYSRAKNCEKVDAFYAKYRVTRTEVYRLSNFGEFRQYLTRFICKKGCVERRKTIDRVFVEKVGGFFSTKESEIRRFIEDKIDKDVAVVRKTRQAIADKKCRWTGNALSVQLLSLISLEINTSAIAKKCIENGYGKKRIKSEWAECLKRGVEKSQAILSGDFQDDLDRTFENMADALKFNADAFARISDVENKGIDGRKVTRWVKRLASWGSVGLFVAANWWNPAGWVVGAAYALAGVAFVLNWVGDRFRSTDSKIQRLKEQFDEHLNKVCGEFCQKAEESFMAAIGNADIALGRHVDENMLLRENLVGIAAVCERANAVVSEVENRMNNH